MASSTRGGSSFFRRIVWLGIAVAAVALIYTGVWFYMARTLEARAAATIATIDGGSGVRAHCEELETRGYPYRLGVFCRSVFYENVRQGVSLRAGTFRSTATVYRPSLVIGELDGPASIVLPFGAAMVGRWDSLAASVHLARPLPERVSLQGRNMTLVYEERGGGPLATVADMQLHARRLEGDLETAFSFARLSVGEEVAPGLPLLEARGQAVLDDGVAVLAGGVPFDPRGRSGTIREMAIGVAGEEAGLALSGPVAVDADGLLDAELSIRVDDPATVARLLSQVFPQARDEIMTAASALGGLADAAFELRVVRGRAFVGFIPLGRIPPLGSPD